MTEILKPKFSEDNFVLVRMNYNYYMIPRWAYNKDSSKGVKQQILNNKKMIKELRAIWNDGEHGIFAENVTKIMEKYFGKRA